MAHKKKSKAVTMKVSTAEIENVERTGKRSADLDAKSLTNIAKETDARHAKVLGGFRKCE